MGANERAGQGSGTEDGSSLDVTPRLKKSVAHYMDTELEPDFAKKTNRARGGSEKVFGGEDQKGQLSGWETGKGVAYCVEQWSRQVADVRRSLHDQMRALRNTGNLFQGEEVKTAEQFKLNSLQGPFRLPYSGSRSALDDL